MTYDVAVVIPLNNPLGTADDTVTVPLCSTSTSSTVEHTLGAVTMVSPGGWSLVDNKRNTHTHTLKLECPPYGLSA